MQMQLEKLVKNLSISDQNIIKGFSVNFILANSRKIEFLKARREKDYIRVDVLMDGRAEWFHVTNTDTWY